MKRTAVIVIVMLAAAALLAGSSLGGGKPLKAMISGAKIAIIEGRPDEALLLLDTVAISFGAVPEAYQWTFRVYADKMEGAAGLDAKRPHLVKMLAYIDSLHLTCEGKIPVQDKKYLKDCAKYIQLADSTKVKYFRFFYNLGHGQVKTLEQLAGSLEGETDSTRLAYIRDQINTNIDSVIANMSMAILIDSSDYSPYVAIGDSYDRAGNYEKANEWMTRGYERAKNPLLLSQQLAYYHVRQDDYCGAIPYFQEYLKAYPDSLNTMNYLAACYNNCGLAPEKRIYVDSAMTIYRVILERAPENPNVWAAGGRYFLIKAQDMSDSASAARTRQDAAAAAQFDLLRRAMFDSSRTYFRTAWEQAPADVAIAEQFAFTSALLEDCPAAVKGFEVVAEAKPDNAENWISLGDCYLRMADFPNAVRAYEKVAALQPGKLKIWENLGALYKETGQADKAAEAAKKVQELSAAGQG